MANLPVSVGETEIQKRFIARHEAFLLDLPEMMTLFEKICRSALEKYNAKPENHQAVPPPEEIEERLAQIIVFYLGEAAFDDFGDLLILAGNGRGFGAFTMLRSMYERVAHAVFIAKNPSEARHFNDHVDMENGKLWNRAVKLNPDIKTLLTPEEIATIESRHAEAKARQKSEVCKTCDQPKTQEAWTRRSLDSMAATSNTGLAALYGSCYLEPTYYSHATAFGLKSRVLTKDGNLIYKENTEEEASKAVKRAHHVLLALLAHQNDYFQLGFDADVQIRLNKLIEIWAGLNLRVLDPS